MIHFGITRHATAVGRAPHQRQLRTAGAVAAGRCATNASSPPSTMPGRAPGAAHSPSIDQFRDEIGLNEFAPRTMAWMRRACTHPPALPRCRPRRARSRSAGRAPSGVEFTQRLGAPPALGRFDRDAARLPPAGGRWPVPLFGIGLVAAVLGVARTMPEAARRRRRLPRTRPGASDTADTRIAGGHRASPPAAPPAAGRRARYWPTSTHRGRVAAHGRTRGGRQPGAHHVRSGRTPSEFTVRSSQDGYVYVLNHGSGWIAADLPNRKSGAAAHPQDAPLDPPQGRRLRIAGPSGSNQLLVIVSRQPRDMAAPMRVDGGCAYFHTGPAATAIAAKHTGPLPWIASTRAEVPHQRCVRRRIRRCRRGVQHRAVTAHRPMSKLYFRYAAMNAGKVDGVAAGRLQLRRARHAGAAVHRRARQPHRQPGV